MTSESRTRLLESTEERWRHRSDPRLMSYNNKFNFCTVVEQVRKKRESHNETEAGRVTLTQLHFMLRHKQVAHLSAEIVANSAMKVNHLNRKSVSNYIQQKMLHQKVNVMSLGSALQSQTPTFERS